MNSVSPNVTDVVSAILVLAGSRIPEGIPRWAIHSILWKMRREEPILSGLHFSITGDVCYSREIDMAINNLLVRGALRTTKDGTILPNDTPKLRSLNLARRTRSNFHELLTASRNFYQRFEEWTTSASRDVC